MELIIESKALSIAGYLCLIATVWQSERTGDNSKIAKTRGLPSPTHSLDWHMVWPQFYLA
jgi:hypothetical protein